MQRSLVLIYPGLPRSIRKFEKKARQKGNVMNGDVSIHPISKALPEDFAILETESMEAGYRFLVRLHEEWNSGETRFNKPGEALLLARHNRQIAGIGGITVDPFVDGVLRMRRFYVRPQFRRTGIATRLAQSLLEKARQTKLLITVNAGTPDAPGFWQRMGFIDEQTTHHTHVLRLAQGPSRASSQHRRSIIRT